MGIKYHLTQSLLRVYKETIDQPLQYAEFVDQAISDLIQPYRIVRTGETPHVVNPLSVSVQPSGKLRLILDLRHVNQYVAKNTVKYEDWRTGLTYFKKDYFMISFDLKSGYHHIDIHPESQTFLGFAWKHSKDQSFSYYIFTVLPFGLTSAPYILTKCLKPLEKYWRRQGIDIALCLDDGWLTEAKYEDCLNLSKTIRKYIKDAGLVTSDDKCIWNPYQELIWLGLLWNSQNGTIAITKRRLDNIAKTIQDFISQKFFISARELASFTGKIISTSAVTKNVSQIMTRHCSMSIAAANDWDSKFQLDSYCIQEIRFWENNISKLNSREVSPISIKSYFVAYSDASQTGCGAHMTLNGEQICHKQWTEEESRQSSTWRELSAVEFALKSFLPMLQYSYVKWYSDSQVACSVARVGSMKKDLHEIAIRIYQLCLEHKIEFELEWILRTDIQKADFLSRFIDIDDWQITRECFDTLERLWGYHTIDCFANYYNTKTSRFISWHWNPGCTGVDFFVQNLSAENCLVVPPISLITRALYYLQTQKAQATVIVPFWTSSYFWPVITRHLMHYVLQCVSKKRLVFEIQISHNYSDLIVLKCVELMIRDKSVSYLQKRSIGHVP